MFLISGHVCSATRISSRVPVAVTNGRVATEVAADVTFGVISDNLGDSIETGFEIHDTTFFVPVNMLRIFSSLKLVSNTIMTASLSMM